MALVDPLRIFLKLFIEIVNRCTAKNTETIKGKLKDCITSQTLFVICAEKVNLFIFF